MCTRAVSDTDVRTERRNYDPISRYCNYKSAVIKGELYAHNVALPAALHRSSITYQTLLITGLVNDKWHMKCAAQIVL